MDFVCKVVRGLSENGHEAKPVAGFLVLLLNDVSKSFKMVNVGCKILVFVALEIIGLVSSIFLFLETAIVMVLVGSALAVLAVQATIKNNMNEFTEKCEYNRIGNALGCRLIMSLWLAFGAGFLVFSDN